MGSGNLSQGTFGKKFQTTENKGRYNVVSYAHMSGFQNVHPKLLRLQDYVSAAAGNAPKEILPVF